MIQLEREENRTSSTIRTHGQAREQERTIEALINCIVHLLHLSKYKKKRKMCSINSRWRARKKKSDCGHVRVFSSSQVIRFHHCVPLKFAKHDRRPSNSTRQTSTDHSLAWSFPWSWVNANTMVVIVKQGDTTENAVKDRSSVGWSIMHKWHSAHVHHYLLSSLWIQLVSPTDTVPILSAKIKAICIRLFRRMSIVSH